MSQFYSIYKKYNNLPFVYCSKFKGSPYNIYLSLLYLKNKKLNNVYIFLSQDNCDYFDFPDMGILWDTIGSKYNPLSLTPSEKLFNELNNCKYKYFICLLALICEEESHCNVLIFDTENKILERFEPFGLYSHTDYKSESLDINLQNLFI